MKFALNPVVVIPAGALPPNTYWELFAIYFLQYAVLPTEYSASFALESERCFSRIVPAFPLTLPLSSITTTWISSNLESLPAAKEEVPGLSARVFQ